MRIVVTDDKNSLKLDLYVAILTKICKKYKRETGLRWLGDIGALRRDARRERGRRSRDRQ